MKNFSWIKRLFVFVISLGILSSSIVPAYAVSTWTNEGNMNWRQSNQKAVLLDDGKVFGAGI